MASSRTAKWRSTLAWLTAPWRHLVGLAICCMGAALLLARWIDDVAAFSPRLLLALAAGGIAAFATALGTLPVLFAQNFSQRGFDCFLGFGAGVMLAATAFSLVVPALAAASGYSTGKLDASLIVGAGMLAGVAIVIGLDRLVRSVPLPQGLVRANPLSLKRVWLFMLAVTLHNMPEGLAIGVAYAGIDIDKANSLATGISIQDVPEGLVVALAFRSVGYRRVTAAALGVASGLIEPVAAVLGVALVGISAALLPIGLAAAAGAMLFVIVHDVVPEFHLNGNGKFASCALAFGFAVMMVLDTALG